jgi:hypothetical protein
MTPPHCWVFQVFVAVTWQQRRRGNARLVTAVLSSARRKHRLVYCCVIAGTYFDITVLAWRKYATIHTHIHIYINFDSWNSKNHFLVFMGSQNVLMRQNPRVNLFSQSQYFLLFSLYIYEKVKIIDHLIFLKYLNIAASRIGCLVGHSLPFPCLRRADFN